MILHLKKDAHLIDGINFKRYSWQAGQHQVEEAVAKQLLRDYPDLFEEILPQEGTSLTPNAEHVVPVQSTQQNAQGFTCDVCGKTVSNQVALIGHKRTHSKGLTTSDVQMHR